MNIEDIPDHITAAAITIADYFGSQGHGNKWQYLNICGRGNAYALDEIKSSPDGLDSLRLTHFQENSQDFYYTNGITMCGRYPCWSVNPRHTTGRLEFKTLREAIDCHMSPTK